jgi:hypothetical protein
MAAEQRKVGPPHGTLYAPTTATAGVRLSAYANDIAQILIKKALAGDTGAAEACLRLALERRASDDSQVAA